MLPFPPVEVIRVAEVLFRAEGIECGSVTDVSFRLQAGGCLCLSGPSGSGKTRILRALADLDPHGGQAWLQGRGCEDWPAHLWRRHVALLPADSQWWEDTVGPHMPHADPDDLKAMGFSEDVARWQVSRLSSGERQRLALVRVASLDPHVLLLDEPTANLDPENTRRVESWLAELRHRGKAMVWVSHDAAQIRRVADQHLNIEAGRLVEAAAA